MNLHLFHPTDDHDRYRRMDRLNGRANPYAVRFYESIGWYNMSVPLRLLGHYRLFQLYKARSPHPEAGMPPVRAYILRCQGAHRLKYFFNRCVSILNFIVTRGGPDPNIVVHGFNRLLLYHHTEVLQEFLIAADNDFDEAFCNAMQKVAQPGFLNDDLPINNTAFVQINNDSHDTHHHTEYHAHPFVREQVLIKEGVKGKGKGVFSKKQILILFDLLAQAKKTEPIDFKKPRKFERVAALLQGLTGKGKDSWIAELKDFQYKSLYEYHSQGELDELIRMLSNLSEIFDKAGLDSIAMLADKKMRELEMRR